MPTQKSATETAPARLVVTSPIRIGNQLAYNVGDDIAPEVVARLTDPDDLNVIPADELGDYVTEAPADAQA